MPPRPEWAAPLGGLALLIVLFLALVWSAARQKSETYDEGLFIGGGVAQVERLDPNFDVGHPPLLRWLAGLSAIALGDAELPPAPPPMTPPGAVSLLPYEWKEFDWTPRFFYEAGHDHERVLFWGRFPFALLGALAAVLVFFEARRIWGRLPAFGAAAALLFTPEVLAHAQWAHSDLAAALTTLIVALALARATERPSTRNDVLLGAAIGLAVLAKITALVLLPVGLVVIAVFDRRSEDPSWQRVFLRLAIIGAVTWGVIVAGYLPRPRVFAHEFLAQDVARLIHAPPEAGSTEGVRALLRVLPLPDSFLKGAVYTNLLASGGQLSFFHGAVRGGGWWYYYPAAILLKYPTPLLALAAVGLIVTLFAPSMTTARKVAWIAPPLTILLLSMTNRVNIGVRSVLPLAPFFALWCGAALAEARGRAGRGVAVALLALSVASGILVYPNFLAWFNPLAGGTPAADRWLVDSNLDWGQDLPALAKALDRRGVSKVRLAYFGAARPEEWGIPALPAARTVSGGVAFARPIAEPEPGWWAVSRSYLSGWWPPGDAYAWLRRLGPVELVGGSIALFRVDPEEASRALRSQPTRASPTTPSVDPENQTMGRALQLLYDEGNAEGALSLFDSVLARNPHHYGALWQRAAALDSLSRANDALGAWRQAAAEAEEQGYVYGLDHARRRVAELEGRQEP